MAGPPPLPKKDVALALLEGDSVYIHLDPRRDGVVVPKQFVKQSQLVLQIGLRLAIRIPDLHIDDEGISCTLSFNRAPIWCRMPWDSIYALVGPDGRGQLWPDDVPPEVAAQMRAGRTKPAAKRPRPRLSAVRHEEGDEAEGDEAEGSVEPAQPGAGPATDAPPPKRPRPRAVPTPAPSLATVPPRRPVGVPSLRTAEDPPPRGAHVKPPARTPAGRPAGSTSSGSSTGSDRGATGAGAKRPKRELPPYLRVVK